MSKVQNYLTYIEDGLKLQDGSCLDFEKRLFKIWARLSEYLYYSEISFEKFITEMGYSEEEEFDLNLDEENESDEEDDRDEENESDEEDESDEENKEEFKN